MHATTCPPTKGIQHGHVQTHQHILGLKHLSKATGYISVGVVSHFYPVIDRGVGSLVTGSSHLSRYRKVEFVFCQRGTCF